MSFSDISGSLADRLKKKREQHEPAQQPEKPVDFKALYALRGRIHGLLIRDARLARGLSVEVCAQLIGITPATLQAWETGAGHPSLPELELLAYELGVPVSHFWANKTLSGNQAPAPLVQPEYVALRNRIIGVQLQQARQEAGLSAAELAKKSGLALDKLQAYEAGQASVPLAELTTLASTTGVSLSHFMERPNRVGQQLAMQEDFQRFQEMDADMRAFITNPTNASFIQLAMWFSEMDVNDLRGLAESILYLGRLDGDAMRQIAESILNDITL
jgi:transcriptional regulator with XRE-family HTH domain